MLEHRRCVDLTLVDALVAELDVLNDEEPVLRVGLVRDLDAVVLDVLELSDGNQAHVIVSDPGNLKWERFPGFGERK